MLLLQMSIQVILPRKPPVALGLSTRVSFLGEGYHGPPESPPCPRLLILRLLSMNCELMPVQVLLCLEPSTADGTKEILLFVNNDVTPEVVGPNKFGWTLGTGVSAESVPCSSPLLS